MGQENGYIVNSDSVRQKYYDITLDVKNTSAMPIGIWLMRCPYQNNFLINNNYFFIKRPECDSNYPVPVKFQAGESKSYKMTLSKSIRFDYSCETCIYGPQVETTKLSLILIDDIFENKLKGPHYILAMEDKSKWRIVWSNSLQLPPTPDN